jgi:hypothetical protein
MFTPKTSEADKFTEWLKVRLVINDFNSFIAQFLRDYEKI